MLQDTLNELNDFTSLEEEDKIFARIREIARSDPEGFIKEVQRLPVGDDLRLANVYEALSDESERWEGFFLDDLERLLQLAEKNPDPDSTLSPLDEFFLLSMDDNYAFHRRIKGVLFRYLDSPNAPIRRKCAALLGDFLDVTNMGELETLEKMARNDPDWRVRYQAYQSLAEEAPDRARGVRLPAWIKLRAKFSDLE